MPKTLLQCYNKGCLKKFDPDENAPDACVHHPGKPVFHDAYKSWSCCKAKTTDFTEFLNIKGCTKSYHLDQKPPESPKPERKIDPELEAQLEAANKEKAAVRAQITPIIRPNENDPLVRLRSSIGSSLTPLLSKLSLEKKVDAPEIEADNIVTVGTTCKNAGCRQTYKGEQSNLDTCFYHAGYPIFHEGMKYWTCCQRKTSDFANFLEQQGCTSGNHVWIKKKTAEAQTSCRYDWYQTGNSVVISIFTKVPIPDESYVEANSVKLHLHITFGEDRTIYDEVMVLHGVIDVEKSLVQYLGTKVEINLKKRDAVGWRLLTLPPQKPRIQDGDGDIEDS
ncbi:cysteine and histidine-rich domain-containing protein 1-like [Rhipicephalus microplus]|uniref:cysteine and histidine-rich domain-containing protein 1-like n=1 Tax=Rhipicephalus microplus TaxID=6941 RepID=UPI003F6C2A1F